MTDKIINGIDVSEYFIDVVDEGGSTIDYKIFPNSERLLVEKIFEQNQQLKCLQEENKRLQMLSCANCGEKYLSPDGAELYEKNVQLQKENEELKKRQITKNGFICDCEQNAKYKQALEEIKNEIGDLKDINKLINLQKILDKINEALKCQ